MKRELTENGRKILTHLLRMNPQERASCYAQGNCFKWPSSLKEYEITGFDSLNHKEKHENHEFRQLMDAIYESTTEFDRSRAWWMEQLQRNSEEHLEWWMNQRYIDAEAHHV